MPLLSPPGPSHFSVVIPCFRARDTVGEALRSVLGQTFADFEVILVDDGSPDDTIGVALDAAAGDARVRVLRQANSGPASARNAGIAAGRSPLVAFLDADDRWALDTLARHRDHFASCARTGVSFGQIRFFDAAMKVPGRCSAHVANLNLVDVLGDNPLCTTSNIVARREVFDAVGMFDPALTHAEDQEWVARVLAMTDWRVCGIDKFLVDYRMSSGGLSADLGRMRTGWQAMLERVRSHAPVQVAAAENEARALFCRYLARRALRTGRPAAEARAHLAEALRSSPRALLANSPQRTLLTVAGALAASVLPAAPLRTLLSR